MANKSDSKALDTLVENLRAGHGENLASIVLYGSVAAGDHVEQLSALMSDSLVSFAALFRAVLILHGQEPRVSKPESVRATVRLLVLNESSFEQLLELRSKSKTLTEAEANNIFSTYMSQIER